MLLQTAMLGRCSFHFIFIINKWGKTLCFLIKIWGAASTYHSYQSSVEATNTQDQFWNLFPTYSFWLVTGCNFCLWIPQQTWALGHTLPDYQCFTPDGFLNRCRRYGEKRLQPKTVTWEKKLRRLLASFILLQYINIPPTDYPIAPCHG